jgi:fucokinase
MVGGFLQKITKIWDYLIVTAANHRQAQAYEAQIRQRKQAGEIPHVRNCLVVADIDGKRIGSGGSTLQCLYTVLQLERCGIGLTSFEKTETIFNGLRILIVHAGGDSRRLPAYSHCGKMFVPVPAKGQSCIATSVATTLFDRLIPAFLALPETRQGQVVVASGDALILFDTSSVQFSNPGITALGSLATSNDAAHHGVFCADKDGSVRQFLQKPSPDVQAAVGAVNEAGDAVLDIGVMSCTAAAAVQLMRAFFALGSQGKLSWKPDVGELLVSKGIDLYREICCALGTSTTLDGYVGSVRVSGSTLERDKLAEWFSCLRQIPFSVEVLSDCQFLHFGTTRQLITSGIALLTQDLGGPAPTSLVLNSDVHGEIAAHHAWVEGCLVDGTLTLGGFNAIIGVNVTKPLQLPPGACLDMSAGIGHEGEKVWFLRYYGIDDTFKHSAEQGGTFCGISLAKWMQALGAVVSDIWPSTVPESERTLWNARVFPALEEHQEFREWLWLLHVESAREEQKIKFLNADRYSSSEIALHLDQVQFQNRRAKMRPAVMPHDSRERNPSQTYAVVLDK